MADVTFAGGRPIIMEDAYVEVGGVNLSCLCEEVSLTAENKTVEITTFCGVKDYPGPTKWHFVAKFLQSFDTASTNEVLSAAVQAWVGTGSLPGGIGCPYKVRPDAGNPVSAGNPEFSGTMIPQPYNKFGGAAGAAAELDIDWSCDGEPMSAITLAEAEANWAKIAPARKAPAANHAVAAAK